MRLSTTLELVLGCVLLLGADAAFGNLITNGNFESGGTGFGSQYQPAFSNTTLGQLTVGATPSQWNPYFTNPTPSSGQMLIVNGSWSALDQVWSSTLTVIAGNTYSVSFDAVSLYDTNPAKLTFYASLAGSGVARPVVLGMSGGPSLTAPAVSVATADLSGVFGTWKKYGGSFSATNTGLITVFITNSVTDSYGNDFAVDNITIVPEPSSLALLGVGSMIGLGVYSRRRRKIA